jgi:hypothetical protein
MLMSPDDVAGLGSPKADQKASAAEPERNGGRGFHRSVGLLSAAAINMTQMVGIGPFITIPLMVATFAGPQAIVGWIAGALLAICDGLVWAELGAAMPGAGGTYLYLREAFQYRTGKLMPFLFIWTIVLAIPLIMSTGIIGLEQYLAYFLPNLGYWPMHLIGVGATAAIVILLYRKVESIKAITIGLWIVMLVAVGMTIAASYTNFHPSLAFHYPHGAFGGGFVAALGAGLLIAIYDYLGYNTVAYMGGELRNPGKVMPRAIIISIFAIMAFYLAMNIGVLGVLPWQKVAHASPVASLAVTHNWGRPAADAVTALILVTAMASVFAGLLGGSRVPVPRGARRAVLRCVRPAAPQARLPAGLPAGDGTDHRRGQLLHADHDHQRAAGGHRLGASGCPDRRADRAAPAPAGPAPPLQAVAVPAAEPRRPRRMAVRLRVRDRNRARMVNRVACRRGRCIPWLGALPPQLAVRPDTGP